MSAPVTPATVSSEGERLLKLLADSVEKGKDFVLEQAPDVVQQYVTWGRIECLIGIILFAVLAVVGTVLMIKCAKHGKANASNYHDDWPCLDIIGFCAGLISSVAGPIGVVATFFTMGMYWFAPKVAVTSWLLHLGK